MELIMLIILTLIYLHFFHKIVNKNKSYDGLIISIVLVILQFISFIGHWNAYQELDLDFLIPDLTMILGSICYGIGFNIYLDIAIIIVIFKSRK